MYRVYLNSLASSFIFRLFKKYYSYSTNADAKIEQNVQNIFNRNMHVEFTVALCATQLSQYAKLC